MIHAKRLAILDRGYALLHHTQTHVKHSHYRHAVAVTFMVALVLTPFLHEVAICIETAAAILAVYDPFV